MNLVGAYILDADIYVKNGNSSKTDNYTDSNYLMPQESAALFHI